MINPYNKWNGIFRNLHGRNENPDDWRVAQRAILGLHMQAIIVVELAVIIWLMVV